MDEATTLPIVYRTDARPAPSAVAALYGEAGLRRPIEDLPRIARMYEGSNLVVSAWAGGRLVGILRGLVDGAYDGYVCDLAVLPEHQRSGIGRELLRRALETFPDAQFVLRASAVARDYYSHLGWQRIENGWLSPRPDWQPKGGTP